MTTADRPGGRPDSSGLAPDDTVLGARPHVRGPRDVVEVVRELFADLPAARPAPLARRRRGSRDRHHAPWAWSISDDASVRQTSSGGLVDGLLDAVDRGAVATSSTNHAVIHAAAVSIDRRAVALVAPSGGGKTTLAAMALRAGWQHIAEEVCAVDPVSLAVARFHRPLGLRPESAALLDIEPLGAVALRGRVIAVRPSALGTLGRGDVLTTIVFLQRHPDGRPPSIDPMSTARALHGLAQQAFAGVAAGARAAMFERLDTVARRVPAVRLVYGDARSAVDLLRRVVA